ncbi:IS3 family transposase [Enterococcus sp. ALS3]|uniref:IS3 family transposase n=1 Tax=Enterococcus alishanensis TaxID=1303817 RepID=A0ABS6THS0_9ENTE|nr:IS3 family transposase [Enterococcus alishanensis]
MAITELNSSKGYSIEKLCELASVSRSGYYKWKNKVPSQSELNNEKLAQQIRRIFTNSDSTFGVVRIQCALKRELKLTIDVKKIRRLMRLMGLFPQIRRKRPVWQRITPMYTADNIIKREFETSAPNQKWFTDVSYLFYGDHQRAYISAIIDRFDMSIVSYVISEKNDNELVMGTIKQALDNNPAAQPIIHSDRGFQYTSNEYHQLKKHYQFEVSMSEAGKCLDNQPIESFWGVLKSEYYYRKDFDTFESLKDGITEYIDFYHTKRYVPKFDGLTPFEYREKHA